MRGLLWKGNAHLMIFFALGCFWFLAGTQAKQHLLDDLTKYLKAQVNIPEVYLSPIGPSTPDDEETVNATVWLYTPRNKGTPKLLRMQTLRSDAMNFNFLMDTKIIIHGASGRLEDQWMQDLKNAFLRLYGSNVLIVDWRNGASRQFYNTVASNSYVAGTYVARLLRHLLVVTQADLGMFHLIGHSIGAHVAGHIGMLLNGKVGRITGLDPAKPVFEEKDDDERLDITDAQFVDAIHTDAAESLSVGMNTNVGHFDVFPNGGENQPGCVVKNLLGDTSKNILNSFNTLTREQLKGTECRHKRATQLFIESVGLNPQKLIATPCVSYSEYLAGSCGQCKTEEGQCAVIGVLARKPTVTWPRTKFFIHTRAESPFFCKKPFYHSV